MNSLRNIDMEALFSRLGISLEDEPNQVIGALQTYLKQRQGILKIKQERLKNILNFTTKENIERERNRIKNDIVAVNEEIKNMTGLLTIFQNHDYLEGYKKEVKSNGLLYPEEFLLTIKEKAKQQEVQMPKRNIEKGNISQKESEAEEKKVTYLERMQQRINSIPLYSRRELEAIKNLSVEFAANTKELTFSNDITKQEYKIRLLGRIKYTAEINVEDVGLLMYTLQKANEKTKHIILGQIPLKAMQERSEVKQFVLNTLLADYKVKYAMSSNGGYLGDVMKDEEGRYNIHIDEIRKIATYKAKKEGILKNLQKSINQENEPEER